MLCGRHCGQVEFVLFLYQRHFAAGVSQKSAVMYAVLPAY
ncbi:hypothetical protein PRUB_a3406 [Pseudoalteromonas rubra]|uniref:Uncharacterized protein n=1 Tax=Pseudoalteromonas rubra TaxID=43658 RepID=A0A8T0C4J2_9GAMM|nr:hypothetical protein PRUB_a3406 [Pseudoalteromonas rubra]